MQKELMRLLAEGPRNTAELADAVCMAPADVTSKLARLIKQGRVLRIDDGRGQGRRRDGVPAVYQMVAQA